MKTSKPILIVAQNEKITEIKNRCDSDIQVYKDQLKFLEAKAKKAVEDMNKRTDEFWNEITATLKEEKLWSERLEKEISHMEIKSGVLYESEGEDENPFMRLFNQ